MRHFLFSLATLFLSASLSSAQSLADNDFAGALRGCEIWVLELSSWMDGAEPLIAAIAREGRVKHTPSVDPSALPPPNMRRANHFWRIGGPAKSFGFILAVSDQIPMCHITGGGDADLQPDVEAVIASEPFALRWQRLTQEDIGEMTSTVFRYRAEPKFTLVISRARRPQGRTDRVQVLATAIYALQPSLSGSK